MKFFYSVILAMTVLSAQSAQANEFSDDYDSDSVRGEVYCIATKFAAELIEKLANADASKTDVVESQLAPRFKIFDGGELPERYFVRADKNDKTSTERDMLITADGRVPEFLQLVSAAPKDSALCISDKARIGRPGDDEGLYFEMGLTPKFKNVSGVYTVAELREGTKDGKSLYKKMIPAIARLFMPDTDHLSLRYDSAKTAVQITAYKDGAALPAITTEFYDEAYVFDLDDIRDMDADRLEIKGGAYQLSPVPSVKTMRKYGMGKKKVGEKNVTAQKQDIGDNNAK